MLFLNAPLTYAALLCVGLLSLTPRAHAETYSSEDNEADEIEHGKINSPDASPVGTGHYEVETIYSFTSAKRLWDKNGNPHARGFTAEHSARISATAGLSENTDISVSGIFRRLKDKGYDFDDDGNPGPETGHGIGDVCLNGRYRFFQSAARNLDVAYIGGVTVPTGKSSDQNEIGTSQEFWSFNQTLVASKDWGKGTANMDVGYALPFGDKRGNARGTFNADLAGGYQALPWLQPELEINYSRAFMANEDDSQILALTAGLVMPINDRWRINTGVQQGLWGTNADKATSYSVAVKIAF